MTLRSADSVVLLTALAKLGTFVCSDSPPGAPPGETTITRFTLTEDAATALTDALDDVRVRLLPTFETLAARRSVDLRVLLDDLTGAVATRERSGLRAALRRTDAFIEMLARAGNTGTPNFKAVRQVLDTRLLSNGSIAAE